MTAMTPTTRRPGPLEPGVWAILPTPFRPDGAVDLASVATCVAFQRERGVTGLVALGVFGEAAALSADEMDAVLAAVVAAADGLPVVAGLDPLGTDEAVALAARLAAAARGVGDAAGPGLRAVMVKVPSPDAATTAAHLRAVAEAAGCGVVVQDYPARSGVTIAPEALAEATLACGAAVAVKAEAAPSAPTVARLVAALAAATLDADAVADVTAFLCGACSCQAKQLAPGFDLLLPAAWDESLFGGAPPPSPASPVRSAPGYVPIPGGAPPGRRP